MFTRKNPGGNMPSSAPLADQRTNNNGDFSHALFYGLIASGILWAAFGAVVYSAFS